MANKDNGVAVVYTPATFLVLFEHSRRMKSFLN